MDGDRMDNNIAVMMAALDHTKPPFVPDAEGDMPGPQWFQGDWIQRAYEWQVRCGYLLPASPPALPILSGMEQKTIWRGVSALRHYVHGEHPRSIAITDIDFVTIHLKQHKVTLRYDMTGPHTQDTVIPDGE